MKRQFLWRIQQEVSENLLDLGIKVIEELTYEKEKPDPV